MTQPEAKGPCLIETLVKGILDWDRQDYVTDVQLAALVAVGEVAAEKRLREVIAHVRSQDPDVAAQFEEISSEV